MQFVLVTRSQVGGKARSISLLSLDIGGIGRKNLAAFSGSSNSAKGLAASQWPIAQSPRSPRSRVDAVQSYFGRGTEHRWFPIIDRAKGECLVRVWALAILCAMTASLVGCSNFGKKSATPNNPPVRGTPQAAAPATPVTPTGSSGILAGQVLDSFNRTPIAATYIQVSEAGEAGKSAAPIEVATDSHGYFMIQRLQPGHHYQLTARMKQGDRLLAGTAFATPPNPKILIQISEDFATKQTPDPPGAPKFPSSPPKNSIPSPEGPPAPVWPDQTGASITPNGGGINNPPPPAPPDQAWAPGNVPRNDPYINGAGRQGGAELGRPSGVFGTPPLSPTPVPQGSPGSPASPSPVILRPEGIVKENSQVRADPLVEIPHQVPQPQASPVPAGPARIPSCVLTGNTLYNFALYDLNGQPWEFRHHQGRLVLIDFWGTWCSHCLVSVKDLNALQDRYGRYGLEVIGIDYEGDASPQDQVLKVRGARQRYGMNYRILLGGNQDTCPVRAQFGVRNFPSAFLIDESNHVIWTSEGLGRQQVRELEIIIRQRLGLR